MHVPYVYLCCLRFREAGMGAGGAPGHRGLSLGRELALGFLRDRLSRLVTSGF